MKQNIHSFAPYVIAILLSLTACSKQGDHASHADSDSAHEHGPDGHTHDGDDGHTEDEDIHATKTPGPNGGRLIETVSPSAEFQLLDDRRVRISFFQDTMQPVAASSQVVSLVGGDRSAPFRISFSKDGDTLLSDEPIPAGDNPPIVLQIQVDPQSESVTEKFYLNLSVCPGCELKEYACICGHE